MIRAEQTAKAITISETDQRRIQELLAGGTPHRCAAAVLLAKKLQMAKVVRPDQIPPDVVTLNSWIKVHEASSDAEYGFRLVIPGTTGCVGDVSVLAPVGAAAIGLRTGQEIFWYGRSGRRVRLRILNVLYQPEAAGQYHL
jgi:regulator of nucleoside diphosphate kinase